MLRVRTVVRVFGATFVVSLLVVTACPGPYVSFPTTSFRCQPSSSAPESRCSKVADYQCCSDDPLALDLANLDVLALPVSGTPVFSGDQNDASYSGTCIKVGAVAPAFALPSGCPIPCNPTWNSTSIAVVCGSGSFCCHTIELEASDCVLDPELGDAGCWRPVRGDDIVGLGGLEATGWSADEHATLQDPGLHGCQAFVAGLSSVELANAGVTVDEVRLACLRRLGVANQRGFCIGGPDFQGCPLAQPSYRDACEQRNDAEALGGCG
jgi:hypothetical protein